MVLKRQKRPLFATFGAFDSGLKSISKPENQKIISLECHEKEELALRLLSTGFDSRYSATGVQWAVKAGIKNGKKILKEVSVHTFSAQFCDASSGRWMDILTSKSLGHENIDTTLIYLQIEINFQQNSLQSIRYPFSEFGRNEVLKP